MRTFFAILVLLTAAALVYAYYCYATPQSWDDTFHVKSSLVRPSVFSTAKTYAYAVDHPSIKRHVYRWVLAASGVTELNVPDVDYHKGEQWNFDNGRVPALRVVMPLRATNAVFMVAALLLVFFSALAVLRNAWAALAVTVPLVFSEKIAAGVVAYIGCDAILAFFLALSLFVAVVLAQKGVSSRLLGALLLGVTGGLAASVKFNGALVPVAFCLYLFMANKGVDRVVRPLIAAFVSAAVFVVLNPVIRSGGLDYALGVAWDMLSRRSRIWESQYSQFPLSRGELVARFFPWAVFVLPLLAALVRLRREKWTLVVAVWSAVLVIGTVLSANRTYSRYFLPVEMGAFFAGGAAAWKLILDSFGKTTKPAIHGPMPLPRLSGICAGVMAGLAMLTFAAVHEPLGTARFGGGSLSGKTKLFYRQAAAYYTAAERVPGGEVRAILGLDSGAGVERPKSKNEPILGTLGRRLFATAAFIAGCAFVVAAGRRALGNAWLGAAAVAPFVWLEAAGLRIWTHSVSEGLLVLFASALLYLLVRAFERGGRLTWPQALVAALLASAAASSSPKGVLLVAATAALCLARDRAPAALAKAVACVGLAVACYGVLEGAFWRLGSSAPLDYMLAMRSGALRYWTRRFADTSNFLLPINECFPYWGLLPLAFAVWVAARNRAWSPVLGSMAFFVVVGTVLTLPYDAARVSTDVNLILSACAGLPALAVLSRDVHVQVRLGEALERL